MSNDDVERRRKAIHNFMDNHGLTVYSWSALAGIHHNTLYSFLNGKNNDLTYGTLEKLARSIGVTVGTVMGEVALPQGFKLNVPGKPESPLDKEFQDSFKSLDEKDKTRALGFMEALKNTGKKKP